MDAPVGQDRDVRERFRIGTIDKGIGHIEPNRLPDVRCVDKGAEIIDGIPSQAQLPEIRNGSDL